MELIEPYLQELNAAFLTAAIGVDADALRKWTGIQIEARHLEALHSALMTGAETAVARGAGAGTDELRRQAIEYALQSVPSAVRALVSGHTVLDMLAERYVTQALTRLR